MTRIALFIGMCLLVSPLYLSAQSPNAARLEVVTKTIKREYPSAGKITIKGEKANIDVQGRDHPPIQVQVRLIAKHQQRAVAEKELDYLRFFGERKGSREVYLHNYFAVPKNLKSVESIFLTEYIVRVPHQIHIRIDNYVGNSKISAVDGTLQIDLKYGDLELQNVAGTGTVQLNLGDMRGSNVNGDFVLISHHASLSLQNLEGTLKVEGANSKLEVRPENESFALQVKGRNMDVTVYTGPEPENYDYQLATTLGSIEYPNRATVHNNQLGINNQRSGRLMDIQVAIGNIIIR
ncbi:MAG: DUF4097 family beta strand repeat-containing protein [Salibacteraceae bacterium]